MNKINYAKTKVKEIVTVQWQFMLAQWRLFSENPRNIKLIWKNLIELSLVRYLIIGFSSFFLNIIGLKVTILVTGLPDPKANIISMIFVLVFNFLMSNYWTFRAGGGNKLKKLLKYSILALFNYFADITIYGFLAETYDIDTDGPRFIAKVIITAMIVSWNFLLYKLWVFK